MPRYDITLREYVDKLGIEYNAKGYADCIFCQKGDLFRWIGFCHVCTSHAEPY